MGKSSDEKSGSRAQYSSKKSKPIVLGPRATSHSAVAGGKYGDCVK